MTSAEPTACGRFRLATLLVSGLVLVLAGCATSGAVRPASRDIQRAALSVAAKPVAGISGLPGQIPIAIAFWGLKRGLLGTGAMRPCAGAVSLTRDGGRSFRVLLRTRGPAEWVTAAGQGEAWVFVGTCKSARGPSAGIRNVLLHTVDGGRSWHALPRSDAFNPSFATAAHGFALRTSLPPTSGSIGLPDAQGLLMSSDGGQKWRPIAQPAACRGSGESIDSPALAQTWLLCAGEPGAGAQAKTIFVSHDGGRSWRVVVNVGLGAREPDQGIPRSGYPLGLSFSKEGFGLLWEDRGLLYVTHDSGHRWRPTNVLIPDVDYGVSGSALSRSRAFVLRVGRRTSSDRSQETDLLRTLDEGHTWTVVHRWKAP